MALTLACHSSSDSSAESAISAIRKIRSRSARDGALFPPPTPPPLPPLAALLPSPSVLQAQRSDATRRGGRWRSWLAPLPTLLMPPADTARPQLLLLLLLLPPLLPAPLLRRCDPLPHRHCVAAETAAAAAAVDVAAAQRASRAMAGARECTWTAPGAKPCTQQLGWNALPAPPPAPPAPPPQRRHCHACDLQSISTRRGVRRRREARGVRWLSSGRAPRRVLVFVFGSPRPRADLWPGLRALGPAESTTGGASVGRVRRAQARRDQRKRGSVRARSRARHVGVEGTGTGRTACRAGAVLTLGQPP
mmetsp:Transcript_4859/g.14793  ORF Transcript_4859/g.14793 Transcript_4859/m.14793 type:complete len:306 (-) Transcript_4859:2-919(-)